MPSFCVYLVSFPVYPERLSILGRREEKKREKEREFCALFIVSTHIFLFLFAVFPSLSPSIARDISFVIFVSVALPSSGLACMLSDRFVL